MRKVSPSPVQDRPAAVPPVKAVLKEGKGPLARPLSKLSRTSQTRGSGVHDLAEGVVNRRGRSRFGGRQHVGRDFPASQCGGAS